MVISRPLFLALAIGTSLIACKVHKTKRGFRIGSGCVTMDESCANASSGNLCRDGALVTVSCKGPKGCVDALPDDVACDQTVAEENDACSGYDSACTPASDALLKCENGAFKESQACASHHCEVTVTKMLDATMKTYDCR